MTVVVTTSSYFSMSHDLSFNVAVSNSKPKNVSVDLNWSVVTPDWDLVNGLKNGLINEDEFSSSYLSKLDVARDQIVSEFATLLGHVGSFPSGRLVLLCWERKDNFCHRHLLLDWLCKQCESYGLDVLWVNER